MTRYPRSLGLSVRMGACLAAVAVVYLAAVSWVTLLAVGWTSVLGSGALASPGAILLAVALVALVPLPFFPGLAQRLALSRLGAEEPTSEEAARLAPVVERLAALADIPPPRIAVVPRDDANAFSTSAIGGSVVAVTRGLLERLDDAELEAVLAHELAHVVNRDAFVMTIAVLPCALARTVVWGIGRRVVRRPALVVAALAFVPFALSLGLGWVAYAFVALFATALSRARELAADEGAALLTGHPETLMSALQALDGASRRIPARDLRDDVAFATLTVVPSEPEGGSGVDPLRLFPTHPPLAVRLEHLAALARRLGRLGDAAQVRLQRDEVRTVRPANGRARLALALVLALYALSAWSIAAGDSDAAFSNEFALAALACAGGGFVLAFQGVARASRGAAGMAYAAAALVLLVGLPFAAFAAMLVAAALGSTG